MDAAGLPPLISKQDKDELLATHCKIAAITERLIARCQQENPRLARMLEGLTGYTAENARLLLRYDPDKEAKSLDTLREEFRPLILEKCGEVGTSVTVGNRYSRRQIVHYTDDKGREVKVYFTAVRYSEAIGATRRGLAKIAKEKIADPRAKEFVGKLVESLTELRNKEIQECVVNNRIFMDCLHLDQYFVPVLFIHDYCSDEVTGCFTVDSVAKGLAKLCGVKYKADPSKNKIDQHREKAELINQKADRIKKAVGETALSAIAEMLEKHYADLLTNVFSLGLTDGSRVDSRNSLMSTMADLLGVPDLVARSEPMTIVDEKGERIHGTAMREAKGMHPDFPTEAAEKIGEHSLRNLEDSHGSGLKALADLQVLDYLCGNLDRNGRNMLYQFDQNGKLVGVQGIDNDRSFGLLYPEAGGSLQRLASPEKMGVISASMAKKVMELTPETLKYMMRGSERSPQEMNAAVDRLKTLQKHIVESGKFYARREKISNDTLYRYDGWHIRIVPDEQFHLVDVNKLISSAYGVCNIFRAAHSGILGANENYLNNAGKKKPEVGIILDWGNRAKAPGLKDWVKKIKALEDELWKLAGETQGAKQRVEQSPEPVMMMLAALAKFRESHEDLLKRLETAEDEMEAVVTPLDLARILRQNQELAEQANECIGDLAKSIYKHKQTDVTEPNFAFKQYKSIMVKVWELANQGKESRDGEIFACARNTRQAKEKQQRRFRQEEAGRQPKIAQKIPLNAFVTTGEGNRIQLQSAHKAHDVSGSGSLAYKRT